MRIAANSLCLISFVQKFWISTPSPENATFSTTAKQFAVGSHASLYVIQSLYEVARDKPGKWQYSELWRNPANALRLWFNQQDLVSVHFRIFAESSCRRLMQKGASNGIIKALNSCGWQSERYCVIIACQQCCICMLDGLFWWERACFEDHASRLEAPWLMKIITGTVD